MLIPTRNVLRRTIMLSIAATRGGPMRLQILTLLEKMPYNINELASALNIDYKTAQHHIRVLQKSGLVVSAGEKYGNDYELSTLMKEHIDILTNLGKSR